MKNTNTVPYEDLKKLNTPFMQDFKSVFDEVLESGWFILGNQVSNFEEQFAAYCQSNYCVGVASGLDALVLSLEILDLPKGKEVIVPSSTYIASILAVLRAGLKPVFAEPDINTYNIDPAKIEEKINKNTVAILPVHLYGKCCEMDKILDLAKTFDLKIIEDAAQAHGAMYKGKKAGTFGDVGCFSFYPTKNLGALGDAGAVVVENEHLAKKCKIWRNYGSNKKYYNEVLGYNSRLDEMQAAFLSAKLKKLDLINQHKRELARLYFDNLKDDYIKPVIQDDYYDVYHIFNIRHPKRDQLKQYLLEQGIKTEIHYPVAPHHQEAMKGLVQGAFPISEEIHSTTLSLPISFCHTEEDVYRVIEAMNKF